MHSPTNFRTCGDTKPDKLVKSRVRGALNALRKEGKAYNIFRGFWLVFSEDMVISRNKGITEAFIAVSDSLSLGGYGADDFEDGGADIFMTAIQELANNLALEEENYMSGGFDEGRARFYGYFIGLKNFAKLCEAMGGTLKDDN
ncbi:MAG: hypothetical protein OXC79_05275 [Candidatus Poribacteria bacterium]|nr:hypothetical protein [Candidatus Poribacteria bacterium]